MVRLPVTQCLRLGPFLSRRRTTSCRLLGPMPCLSEWRPRLRCFRLDERLLSIRQERGHRQRRLRRSLLGRCGCMRRHRRKPRRHRSKVCARRRQLRPPSWYRDPEVLALRLKERGHRQRRLRRSLLGRCICMRRHRRRPRRHRSKVCARRRQPRPPSWCRGPEVLAMRLKESRNEPLGPSSPPRAATTIIRFPRTSWSGAPALAGRLRRQTKAPRVGRPPCWRGRTCSSCSCSWTPFATHRPCAWWWRAFSLTACLARTCSTSGRRPCTTFGRGVHSCCGCGRKAATWPAFDSGGISPGVRPRQRPWRQAAYVARRGIALVGATASAAT
mmetsp:Transcript_47556/g.152797  ORF Transcript_47556/g.152797 Transcript_47556/m.152797 type:complete len:330 (+) Transcript_47556:275-1264(+)